jgi:hypothetical protein
VSFLKRSERINVSNQSAYREISCKVFDLMLKTFGFSWWQISLEGPLRLLFLIH